MKTSHHLPLVARPMQGGGDSWGSELAPPTPFLRKSLLTLPGTGLLDQVLPLRLVGHLDEAVLTAFGQHLLHGGWGDMATGAENGVATSGVASQGPPSHPPDGHPQEQSFCLNYKSNLSVKD